MHVDVIILESLKKAEIFREIPRNLCAKNDECELLCDQKNENAKVCQINLQCPEKKTQNIYSNEICKMWDGV